MRRYRVPLLLFGLTLLVVVPYLAHAQIATLSSGWSLFPKECQCGTSGGVGSFVTQYASWGCVIIVLQQLVNFAVSIGVIIAVLVLAYAGFLWVINPISPENRSTARGILLNAIIGLILTLGAWLLINTLLTVLGTSVGAQTQILNNGSTTTCESGAADQGNQGGSGTSNNNNTNNNNNNNNQANNNNNPGCGGINGDSSDGGSTAAAVCGAAASYCGQSTSAGPDGGNKACAWSVNNILNNAGVGSLGSNSVRGEENALQGGRGQSESQSSAACGDIVIQGQDGHIGICLNNGCTQVISNSSSHAAFQWISGPTFAPSYSGGGSRFYRLGS